jgi:hypothetical protein
MTDQPGVYAGEYKGTLSGCLQGLFFVSHLWKIFNDSFWEKTDNSNFFTRIPQSRSKNFIGESDGNIFLKW